MSMSDSPITIHPIYLGVVTMATRRTQSGFNPLRFHYRRLKFEVGVRVRCFTYGAGGGMVAGFAAAIAVLS